MEKRDKIKERSDFQNRLFRKWSRGSMGLRALALGRSIFSRYGILRSLERGPLLRFREYLKAEAVPRSGGMSIQQNLINKVIKRTTIINVNPVLLAKLLESNTQEHIVQGELFLREGGSMTAPEMLDNKGESVEKPAELRVRDLMRMEKERFIERSEQKIFTRETIRKEPALKSSSKTLKINRETKLKAQERILNFEKNLEVKKTTELERKLEVEKTTELERKLEVEKTTELEQKLEVEKITELERNLELEKQFKSSSVTATEFIQKFVPSEKILLPGETNLIRQQKVFERFNQVYLSGEKKFLQPLTLREQPAPAHAIGKTGHQLEQARSIFESGEAQQTPRTSRASRDSLAPYPEQAQSGNNEMPRTNRSASISPPALVYSDNSRKGESRGESPGDESIDRVITTRNETQNEIITNHITTSSSEQAGGLSQVIQTVLKELPESDLNNLSDKLYRKLERRLLVEKERRGIL